MVHCDLKASNVLVSDNFQAKIADLGLSRINKSSREHPNGNRRAPSTAERARGTPFWMPPECLAGMSNSPESDVYSFGITLFEIMARTEPYEGQDPVTVLRGVQEGAMRPGVPEGCSFKVRCNNDNLACYMSNRLSQHRIS